MVGKHRIDQSSPHADKPTGTATAAAIKQVHLRQQSTRRNNSEALQIPKIPPVRETGVLLAADMDTRKTQMQVVELGLVSCQGHIRIMTDTAHRLGDPLRHAVERVLEFDAAVPLPASLHA